MYCFIPEKLLHFAPQGNFLRDVYGNFNKVIDNKYNLLNTQTDR